MDMVTAVELQTTKGLTHTNHKAATQRHKITNQTTTSKNLEFIEETRKILVDLDDFVEILHSSPHGTSFVGEPSRKKSSRV
jgi:hypothetical protein